MRSSTLEGPPEQARRWFLDSGIQESSGGVARYYRSEAQSNAGVSNEITGYAASALVYLGEIDAAVRAARFLANHAWDAQNRTFPFEPGSPLAYFFDIGIIVRGLLAVWRATGHEEFLRRARDGACSLASDFSGDGFFHPVISLPEKQPLAYQPWWSRSPGCYQLKSALALRELGGEHEVHLFESALASALSTHRTFLDGVAAESKMDYLHSSCYFLEALLWEAGPDHGRDDVRRALDSGIARVAAVLREISPRFERSDVCAQLLRLRLIAHHLNAVPLDENAAREEAQRAALYQSGSDDPRLCGGFWFGRRGGEILPFMNPVSTAFCAQALDLWRQHQNNEWTFQLHQLI